MATLLASVNFLMRICLFSYQAVLLALLLNMPADASESDYANLALIPPVRYIIHSHKLEYSDTVDNPLRGSAELKYPEIIDGLSLDVADSINRFIKRYVFRHNNAKPIDTSFIEQVRHWLKGRERGDEMGVGFSQISSASVITNSSGVLTIQFSWWGYFGGAHPNNLLKYSNFELVSGSVLKLEDILVDGHKHFLDSLGELEFRVVHKLD